MVFKLGDVFQMDARTALCGAMIGLSTFAIWPHGPARIAQAEHLPGGIPVPSLPPSAVVNGTTSNTTITITMISGAYVALPSLAPIPSTYAEGHYDWHGPALAFYRQTLIPVVLSDKSDDQRS